ncbi:MAG: hypothetical protein OEM02_13625 [Desulfobulbaceae bacterium]|nr:hypothetical protein [Desulfobulbaceae bacterium]
MKKNLIIFLLLLPIVLSVLAIGAHFFRSGNHVVLLLCFNVLFCLFFRHPLVARGTQLALILATVEWIRTLVILVTDRADHGEDWVRVAFILGGVSLFTIASSCLFMTKHLRERYGLIRN